MSIVDSDQYFLRWYRYIELSPVKAKMVIQPENYRWSSYRENAGLSSSGIIDRHGFAQLNGVSFEDYRNYVAQDTPAFEAEFISQRLESNRLTGGYRFVKEIESRTGIRLEYKRAG
jgi:putative transposase